MAKYQSNWLCQLLALPVRRLSAEPSKLKNLLNVIEFRKNYEQTIRSQKRKSQKDDRIHAVNDLQLSSIII